MVFTIDGRQMLTAVVEGSTDYNYARGETVVRVPVTAGDHFLRASFPELANLDDPRVHINRDGRRKIFVDYMDIVGPYEPSRAPAQSYARIFICGHPPGRHNAQCARRVVENLAHRAYRRPPTERELEPLLKLVALAQKQGDSLEEGVRVSLQAILMSPNFLFRIERDPAGGAGAYRLNDHELASRLSYFLWSSMPDDELLQAADRGTLRQPGVLEAQVRRMLDDPKANALADNFAAQWLNLRLLDRKKPDAERFPTVDDELLDAMRRETLMFVTAVMREDRSVLEFIDGKFTFLNGPLARHYGIKGIDGEAFQRVRLEDERARRHRDTGIDPDAFVVRYADLAGAARQMAAGKSAGHVAAAAAGGGSAAGRGEPRHCRIGTAAAGTASGESGLRRLPRPDGSARLQPGELRCGRPLAHARWQLRRGQRRDPGGRQNDTRAPRG